MKEKNTALGMVFLETFLEGTIWKDVNYSEGWKIIVSKNFGIKIVVKNLVFINFGVEVNFIWLWVKMVYSKEKNGTVVVLLELNYSVVGVDNRNNFLL